MKLVYYAHSYREVDAPVVEFFLALMRSEHFIPSLDPPSDRLNSAKPERHLRSTDGLIAVLTAREQGISQYILYEISLAIRSQKPLLVFVEDLLPNDLIPLRVLQRRFNRSSLLREVRSHRHALRALTTYLGDEPPPIYEPSVGRRRCLMVGTAALSKTSRTAIETFVDGRGYTPDMIEPEGDHIVYDATYQERISTASMAICVAPSPKPLDNFLFGSLRSSLVPTVLLTTDPSYAFHQVVPMEYQARPVGPAEAAQIERCVRKELDILEEEYLELENQEDVVTYAALLIDQSSATGHYGAGVRDVYISELAPGKKVLHVSGDNVDIDNVGGVVNYRSSLERVSQMITSSSLPGERKTEVQRLVSALAERLAEAHGSFAPDIAILAKTAELLMAELTRVKPNRAFLKLQAKGLEEAAKTLEIEIPEVSALVRQIAVLALH